MKSPFAPYVRSAIAACCIASASVSVQSAAVWGATEWTQIANNMELVVTAMQTIETATNTLNSFKQLKAMLEQLNPANIAAMIGGQSAEFQQLVGLYDKLNEAKSAYQDVSSMLQNSVAEMKALGQNPGQYLQFRAKLSMAKGGMYKANYEADIAKVDNAKKQAQDLNKLIKSIPNITSTVGGLQAVVSSNTRIIGTMQSMGETIARNAAIASKDKQEDAEALAKQWDASKRRMAEIDARPAVTISFPKPSELTGTTGER
jgi:conjugal transfer/entry exclusion protein